MNAGDILTAAGIEHSGMSEAGRKQLAKFIADRSAKRAKRQAKVIAELEHPLQPTPKKRGPRWHISLMHGDGRRIDLGTAEFPSYLAAQRHLLAFKRDKASLSEFIPMIEEVR